MTRNLSAVTLLTVLWMALWESISWANVAGGLAVAGLAVYLAPAAPASGRLTVRPLALLHLLGYFMWKLVEASVIVAWEVITPRDRTNEAVVAIPIKSTDRFMITTVANAVSLTPGTLILEIRENPTILYMHVLHFKSLEAVRADVRRLEDHAIRALVRSYPTTGTTTAPDQAHSPGGPRP